jgi:hypothetical protein
MLCSANYELTKADETTVEPQGSAYLFDNDEQDWYSFDGAIISEFAPDKDVTGFSLSWTSEQVCAGKEHMNIKLELQCNEDVQTLTKIDESQGDCSAVFKYESEAVCSYVTMRPMWNFMNKVRSYLAQP